MRLDITILSLFVLLFNLFAKKINSLLIYAILSLTLVRIVPVGIALIKTGIPLSEKLFIGWFGQEDWQASSSLLLCSIFSFRIKKQ